MELLYFLYRFTYVNSKRKHLSHVECERLQNATIGDSW